MNGSVKISAGLIFGLLCAGCEANQSPAKPLVSSLAEASSAYNPATVGEVAGRVEWVGTLPDVPPFQAPVTPLAEQTRGPSAIGRIRTPPSSIPKVTASAMPSSSCAALIRSGRGRGTWTPFASSCAIIRCTSARETGDGHYGFVRRGDRIELESKQNFLQTLQGRGADYFALTMPEQGTKRDRVLDHNGVVELTSNSGQFWMRGYVFVDDHPYYVRTDRDGRFTLPQAPPGDYDLVCWMPDWRKADDELDADTRLVERLTFRPPLQVVRHIHIEPGATATADFSLSLNQFDGVRNSGR